jgi:RNA polymerase sigma factor (sigma-70 family)
VIDPGEKEKVIERIMAQSSQWIRGLAKDSAHRDSWQDLEQEIYMALWQSLDRFTGRSSLSTWVYSVAQNTVKNFSRKNHNAQERNERVHPVSILTEQNHDEARILREFINKLAELDRQVFTMCLDDIGYREMSEATGIDKPNLRKRLSRLKEQFKATYNGI